MNRTAPAAPHAGAPASHRVPASPDATVAPSATRASSVLPTRASSARATSPA